MRNYIQGFLGQSVWSTGLPTADDLLATPIQISACALISGLGGDCLQRWAESQKGVAGTFSCVGLIEKAAEVCGVQSGQGFVLDRFETAAFLFLPSAGLSFEIPSLTPSKLLEFARFESLLRGSASSARASVAAGASESPGRMLEGIFESVDFLVTDPIGRRVGFTTATGFINEIPESSYAGDGPLEQLLIFDPLEGDYQLQVFGKGVAAFAGLADSSAISDAIHVGLLAAGEEMQMTLEVPEPAPFDMLLGAISALTLLNRRRAPRRST